MPVDVNVLQDKMMELVNGGTEEELSRYLIEEVAPIFEEMRELRRRVDFLEVANSTLEAELEQERGP